MNTRTEVPGSVHLEWSKILLVDIDDKYDVEILKIRVMTYLERHGGGEAVLYETNKGYHVYIKTNERVFYVDRIVALCEFRADVLFIRRLALKGHQTLFKVRRGKLNETFITRMISSGTYGEQ